MGCKNFPHLFAPLQIGSVTVKNRVFYAPITSNYGGLDGRAGEDVVQHLALRAKGGAGLVFSGATTPDPEQHYSWRSLTLKDDESIPGFARIAQEVHKYGSLFFPQLMHAGHAGIEMPGGPRLVAASHVGYLKRYTTRSLEIEELERLVEIFGKAAQRAQMAGCDGVEIHAAHDHGLVGGFLSPLYNKRFDAYGGNVDGRAKLLLDIIREVKKVCGKDFPVSVRLTGCDYIEGGITHIESVYVARKAAEAGADLLHVSGGSTIYRPAFITGPASPQASHLENAVDIKKYVDIPVAVVGRINEPWVVEQILAYGQADACVVGRGLLCDPEFVNKAYRGEEDKIRPCIGCLHCLNNLGNKEPVSCTVNPAIHIRYGADESGVPKSDDPHKVLVIGGGPAGMEAAYVAALRGHDVTLVEKEKTLGGALRLAVVPPTKQILARLARFLAERLDEAGVHVITGTKLTAEDIKKQYTDHEIIVAAGSEPVMPKMFQGHKQAVSAFDILSGKEIAGENVVVIGGGAIGCEVAEYLAPVVYDRGVQNRRINIIEMRDEIAMDDTSPARSYMVRRLLEKGVRVLCGAKVTEVSESDVKYMLGDSEEIIKNVDTVIIAVGTRPDQALATSLQDAGTAFKVIGDNAGPGRIYEALKSAFECAQTL